MVIERILNNNVIIVLDENGNKQVVGGKGIAYKKKIGDEVSEDDINEVYVQKGDSFNEKFEELLSEIPTEHLKLAKQIIELAKSRLGRKIGENLFISLSDHIYTSVKRFKEGIVVKNAVLWDIKRFYEDEYAIGLKALDMIEDELGVRLPNDEAAFIAIHIVNAKTEDSSIAQVNETTRIIKEITNIVKHYFHIEFNEESAYYYRFITHVKFFAQRLIKGDVYDSNEEDVFLDTIKERYSNSFNCVELLNKFVQKEYNYTITDEEKLYLTIHVERVVYKTNK